METLDSINIIDHLYYIYKRIKHFTSILFIDIHYPLEIIKIIVNYIHIFYQDYKQSIDCNLLKCYIEFTKWDNKLFKNIPLLYCSWNANNKKCHKLFHKEDNITIKCDQCLRFY